MPSAGHRHLPAGGEHWHGAAANTFMSHLAMLGALSDGGDPTTWLEPLPQSQYTDANHDGTVVAGGGQ